MHTCPDCGQACTCNGDIEDCDFGDEQAEIDCECCLGAPFVEDEDFSDYVPFDLPPEPTVVATDAGLSPGTADVATAQTK